MGLAVFLLALAVPSPGVGWFDGLPWDGRAEMLVLVLVLPLLLFWRPRLFVSRVLVGLALVAFFLKSGLWLLQPADGLRVDVFENREKFEQGVWEKNWSSLWVKEGSALQRRAFFRAAEFPVEWINRYNQVEKLPDGSWSGDLFRREARPWVRVSGWVWTRPGESVRLQFGPDISSIAAKLSSSVSLESARGDVIELPASDQPGWNLLEVSFRMDSVFSDDASFAPSLRLEDGREKPLFGLNRCKVSQEGRPRFFMIGLGPWLTRLIDGLVGLCLLIPVLQIFRHLCRDVLMQFVILTTLALGGPVLVGACGMEFTGRLTYGLLPACGYAMLAGPLLGFASPGRVAFWILGVGAMPQFAAHWWADMRGMSFFEVGDDWLAQQNLARAIFVGGDWLSFISEKIYVYQPGYRYFTGILHVLFGQSAWPSRMLDAWAVVAVGSLVPALCLWAGTGNRWAMVAGFLAFAAYCSRPPFRIMGHCIHEYVGAALLVGVAWIVVNWNQLPMRFVLLGITAVAAYLVRQNHIFAILACGLFFLPRMEGSWRQVFSAGIQKIRLHKAGWLALLAAIVLAVLMVCCRNYVSGGVFNINNPRNLAANSSDNSTSFGTTLGLILRAKAVGGWSHMGGLIAAGLGAAVLTLVVRRGMFCQVPVEPALMLLATLAPYAAIRLYPCTERFSYVLVPWAALCFAVWGSRCWGRNQSAS